MGIFVQILGFAAMAMILLSFQQNTHKGVLLLAMVGCTFFTVHFLLLGAYTGSVLNFITVARSFVYYNNDKAWAKSKLWIAAFIIVSIAVGIFTWEGLVSLLPMTAMVMSTISFSITNPSKKRFLTFPTSPMWLVYDVIFHSYFGIATEICVMTSILVAIVRYDILTGKIGSHRNIKKAPIKNPAK